MAFPVDAARATTNGTAAATNKVCNLPTGITAGDLLLLILRSAAADTHSTPSGWTALVLNNTADASDDTTSIWYRRADGTEGSTVTVAGSASVKFAAICWRITGAGTPQISSAATGSSTAPNPPAFAPSGGAKDYLWVWVGGWEGEQTSPPAGSPTNYVNPVGANSGTAGVVATNCQVAGATRQRNTSSEDPPAWTISASDDWTAWTVAIGPGALAASFAVAAVGVASMRRRLSLARLFSAVAVAVPGMSTLSRFRRTLAVVATGVPGMTVRSVFRRAFSAVATGVAGFGAKLVFRVLFAAAATAVASMSRRLSSVRTFAAVATALPAVSVPPVLPGRGSGGVGHVSCGPATEVLLRRSHGCAGVVRRSAASTAVAAGVAAMSDRLVFRRTFSAVATGVPASSARFVVRVVFSVVGSGLASLSATFQGAQQFARRWKHRIAVMGGRRRRW